MSAISQALSLMKVKHDKYKTAAIEEYNELLRLAKIGRATIYAAENYEGDYSRIRVTGYEIVDVDECEEEVGYIEYVNVNAIVDRYNKEVSNE